MFFSLMKRPTIKADHHSLITLAASFNCQILLSLGFSLLSLLNVQNKENHRLVPELLSA